MPLPINPTIGQLAKSDSGDLYRWDAPGKWTLIATAAQGAALVKAVEKHIKTSPTGEVTVVPVTIFERVDPVRTTIIGSVVGPAVGIAIEAIGGPMGFAIGFVGGALVDMWRARKLRTPAGPAPHEVSK